MVVAVVFAMVLASCSRGGGSDPSGDDESSSGTSEDSEPTSESSTSTTEPPPPELSDLQDDPVFDGGNSEADIAAVVDLMSENSFDFNPTGLRDNIGDCSQLNGGLLGQFLGTELVVLPSVGSFTKPPYLSCQLVAADDPERLLGQVHFSPDDQGFGLGWGSMNNKGTDLTPVGNLGESAGWTEGVENQLFFSVLVVVEGGTQSAIEFRSPDGNLFAPGKIPGMIGALSLATADVAP